MACGDAHLASGYVMAFLCPSRNCDSLWCQCLDFRSDIAYGNSYKLNQHIAYTQTINFIPF